MRVEMPIHTVSLLNKREPWQVTARRKRLQREMVRRQLANLKPPALPVAVNLTRISAGRLDTHDNLPSAFKHVVDALAQWLGVDDSDPRVTWSYDQGKGQRGTHFIVVEIV